MKHLFILVLILLPISALLAQNDSIPTHHQELLEIRLKDGSILKGKVRKSSTNTLILVQETLGEIRIPKTQIAEIKLISRATKDEAEPSIFPTPKPMSYFVFPSNFQPETGEIYYHNQYLFLNSIEFGMHPRFSTKIGFEVISIYSGNPIFYLMPKYSLPIAKKWRVGTAFLGLFMSNFNNNFISENAVLGFGAGTIFLTYGTPETHLTAGIGYAFGAETDVRVPFYTLSGTARLSRKVCLLVENWFLPWKNAYLGLGSAGIRILGKKNAVDIGLARPSSLQSEIEVLGIPYLGFTVQF